jgi:ABC-type Fe3+/spermidine/putrescine transport system ATPase subunit
MNDDPRHSDPLTVDIRPERMGTEDMGHPPMVSLRDVCKSFASISAVLDINLRIRKGEFVSLLGPSGCGKTTTLSLSRAFFCRPRARYISRIETLPVSRRIVGV